jgi:pimeloyl-ACP methyl ester carboxylesterase
MERTDITFSSRGRRWRLDIYAERFAAAGLAALVFDYRNFGASEGEPRQLLDIGMQQEDWLAAIARARGLDKVDPERIALWGTSHSGGHAVALAAREPRIAAAVVAQVPFADGITELTIDPPLDAHRKTAAAVTDAWRASAAALPTGSSWWVPRGASW